MQPLVFQYWVNMPKIVIYIYIAAFILLDHRMLPITCIPQHTDAAISVAGMKWGTAEESGTLGLRTVWPTSKLKPAA